VVTTPHCGEPIMEPAMSSRSPTVLCTSPARPATRRRTTIGRLTAIATVLAACASLFAFVLLHRSPLPEESVLLAASTLADPWHVALPPKSSP